MMEKVDFKYYLLIFMIGSFIGWIYELLFYLLVDHVLVNSGFLYGPYVPVYGFGAVLMVIFLKRFKKNPFVLFLMAVLLTGVLEYVTGIVMWEIWSKRWWDYTGLFLNIGGYVCLRSVITFGIGGLILMYLIEPNIKPFIKNNQFLVKIFCMCFLTFFLIDNLITFTYRHPIL